jgi:hypothetical protein
MNSNFSSHAKLIMSLVVCLTIFSLKAAENDTKLPNNYLFSVKVIAVGSGGQLLDGNFRKVSLTCEIVNTLGVNEYVRLDPFTEKVLEKIILKETDIVKLSILYPAKESDVKPWFANKSTRFLFAGNYIGGKVFSAHDKKSIFIIQSNDEIDLIISKLQAKTEKK